ncbi:hypothetical protein [Mangrovibacterium marinum]|uniref:Uncharacterized protein n=1 Tax=Mangrovibacterium marinum TaxID=1639118 RepID=A0A2T5C4W7_9BACT|nr:hypothetical protein [Mangrovibacterium marinum]PTN09887.1 hypothetical protein C8N47_103184 [Mangrovibacterium marinum]
MADFYLRPSSAEKLSSSRYHPGSLSFSFDSGLDKTRPTGSRLFGIDQKTFLLVNALGNDNPTTFDNATTVSLKES